MEKSKKIAVIGAGFMGAVIASIYARYGYNVALHDQIPSVLGSFHDRALPNVQNLSNAEHSVEDIFGNVTVESELDGAIDGAFLARLCRRTSALNKNCLHCWIADVSPMWSWRRIPRDSF
jgi:glycerol-3-phosphate dehydrogenase